MTIAPVESHPMSTGELFKYLRRTKRPIPRKVRLLEDFRYYTAFPASRKVKAGTIFYAHGAITGGFFRLKTDRDDFVQIHHTKVEVVG